MRGGPDWRLCSRSTNDCMSGARDQVLHALNDLIGALHRRQLGGHPLVGWNGRAGVRGRHVDLIVANSATTLAHWPYAAARGAHAVYATTDDKAGRTAPPSRFARSE